MPSRPIVRGRPPPAPERHGPGARLQPPLRPRPRYVATRVEDEPRQGAVGQRGPEDPVPRRGGARTSENQAVEGALNTHAFSVRVHEPARPAYLGRAGC